MVPVGPFCPGWDGARLAVLAVLGGLPGERGRFQAALAPAAGVMGGAVVAVP